MRQITGNRREFMWILWTGWLSNSTAEEERWWHHYYINLPILLLYSDAILISSSICQVQSMYQCSNPLSSSISQVPQTIWKYNVLFHLASEHSTGTTPPKITGQLLVNMFVSKEEEKALKIEEEDTDWYRKEHNIPDTDGLGNEGRMGK